MKISIINLIIIICLQIGIFGALSVISEKIINYGYNNKFRGVALIINIVLTFLIWIGLINQELLFSVVLCVFIINTAITILIEITFIDFKYFEIPDSYNLSLTILGIINVFVLGNYIKTTSYLQLNYLVVIFLIALTMFVMYFILAIFSGGGLGMGDVKMSFGLGLLLSSLIFLTLGLYYSSNASIVEHVSLVDGYIFGMLNIVLMHALYSFVSGALVSIVLLLLKLKKKTDKIAFGPYFMIGFIVIVFLSKYSFIKL